MIAALNTIQMRETKCIIRDLMKLLILFSFKNGPMVVIRFHTIRVMRKVKIVLALIFQFRLSVIPSDRFIVALNNLLKRDTKCTIRKLMVLKFIIL